MPVNKASGTEIGSGTGVGSAEPFGPSGDWAIFGGPVPGEFAGDQAAVARSVRERQAFLRNQLGELRKERDLLDSQRRALGQALASLRKHRDRAMALTAPGQGDRLTLRALDGRSHARSFPALPVEPARESPEHAPAERKDSYAAPLRTELVEEARPERRPPEAGSPAGREALGRAEQKVVDALAWLETMGLSPGSDAAIACLAGYRVRSAGWVALRRKLRRRGLLVPIEGAAQLELTQEGRARASRLESPHTADELRSAALARLDVPERRILDALLAAHPGALDLAELARCCRYDRDDAAFRAARGRLRALGLISGSASAQMRVNDVLLRHGKPSSDPQGSRDGARTAEERPPAHLVRPRLIRGGLRFAPSADRRTH